ncbi:TetR family transcriptional regulator C-terminal domain-containing protein [Wenyingzhuangia sp. chi5]|uniref:TetR family transcriptional regulator C-terminal domain-containing protein n=1 Tax=Wenyingzhuangia gilva TaxID=3057677 RepID=A0ABT8VU95_9FLAO|nr:TetR family transcriptional regulator C-terminal domain-containing protein [Wenyingzhuangia sp. chi5]MDO3695557.1 TetR family transcriptional regulator C-terminal domain-containing protein [Wenyingzhuangia sp. chi5]
MKNTQNISKQEILTAYMNHVLDFDNQPNSIHAFAKKLGIDEKYFYNHYTSFDQIAADVYVTFYEESIKLMMSEISYNELDSRNELLAFYFTFFELLTNNRSYVLSTLNKPTVDLKRIKVFIPLRNRFKEFIKSLNIETLDLKQEKINTLKEKSIEEIAWTQLLFTIKFWMEDTSPGFEKTDVFIEKSVNACFDLLDYTPLESIIDFGKFFFKEKIKSQY